MSDNLQMPDDMRIFLLEKQLAAVTAERDKLKAEVVRLSGKTGFCTECERQAQEIVKLKEEREQMEEESRELARMLNNELSGGTFMGEPYLPNKHWETREMAHLDAQVAKCAHPPVPDGKVLVHDGVGGAPEHFRDWFTMNIPDGTIIGNSHWWVNRVYNAMLKAAQQGE